MTNSPEAPSSRYLPLLVVLFAGSGCAALIYEIVWYQLLQLAIGATAISVGFLLATFMGGLCLGSAGYSRVKRAQKMHPLLVYAYIEVGIAACAILVLFGLPLVEGVYFAAAGYGLPGLLLRGFLSSVCLLPPTILMGASLPAATRWIQSTPRGISWWGLLYGANTAGAVFGCLLAGFYLLRIHNTAVATAAAVAINLAVAAVAWWMSGRTPDVETDEAPVAVSKNAESLWPIHLSIAISGACALGAEVVWTRLMGMMLGATVYVFAIILAVFLIGLAIGSTVGSWISRTVRAQLALGWCQMLLTAAIGWTAYMIADSLPYWPIDSLLSTSPWYQFQIDMARCLWAILPPTLLWGASFPLALAAAGERGGDSGKVVGGVYAANTLGAIIGALGVSLVLVPTIGTQAAQKVILLLSAVGGLVMLLPHVRKYRSPGLAAGLVASVAIAFWLSGKVDPIPGEVIGFGRRVGTSFGKAQILEVVEGRNSSVVYSRWNDGAMQIDVNGHVEATNEPYDMKLQRMVGHLAALLHPSAKSVLGIGFGAGVSAGTFTRYPGVEHITVCEIEPVIPPLSTKYFAKENYEVFKNPKTRVIFDDARHYLMTTRDMYDIIASDPLDVFVRGTAALYTKEYFDAVKRHLTPGGMFTLYVPLYETDMRTIKSELATFFEAFPEGTIWANTIDGQGYDMVFMGQEAPLKVDLDDVNARLSRPEFAPVVQSLAEIAVYSSTDLFSTYAGRKADYAEWLKNADINRDRDLRLQYLGGWGINSQLEHQIYREMVKYSRPPVGIFTGSPARVQALMTAIGH